MDISLGPYPLGDLGRLALQSPIELANSVSYRSGDSYETCSLHSSVSYQ